MKRLVAALLFAASPALAQENGWQEIQNGWGEIQTALGSYSTMPAPSGCASGLVPYFNASLQLVCSPTVYAPSTDVTTLTGSLVAKNLTATGLATPGAITVTPVLSQVGAITVVAGGLLADGDGLVVGDGTGTVPIEFDASPGDGTTGGAVPIIFDGTETATQIRDAVKVILDGAGRDWTTSAQGADGIGLVRATPGATGGGIAEDVTNAGFLVTDWTDPTHATTYTYRLVWRLPDGKTTEGGAASSTAAGVATLTTANRNDLTWAAGPAGTVADVYRTVGGATQGKIAAGLTGTTLSDTGLAGGGETAPTVDGTGRITSDALTAGRVAIVGAGGRVEDDAGLTYDAATTLVRIGDANGITIRAISSALGEIHGYGTNRLSMNAEGTLQFATRAGSYEWETESPFNDFVGYKWASSAHKTIRVVPSGTTNMTPFSVGGWGDVGIQDWMTRGNHVVASVGSGGEVYASRIIATDPPQSLAAPATVTITQVGTGGATTYSYLVAARHTDGTVSTGTIGTTATGNATLDLTNRNSIAFDTVAGAVDYDVYRIVGGATQGLIANNVTGTITDTGTVANATYITPTVPPVRTAATPAVVLGPSGHGLYEASATMIGFGVAGTERATLSNTGYFTLTGSASTISAVTVYAGASQNVKMTQHGVAGSKTKTLTDATPTAFATIPMADGMTAGGRLIYRVVATDGSTARQVVSGSINYAAARNGATYGVDYDEIQQSTAVSTGTLTGAVTVAGASDLLTFSANFDTDLGTPVLTIYYRFDTTDTLAVTGL